MGEPAARCSAHVNLDPPLLRGPCQELLADVVGAQQEPEFDGRLQGSTVGRRGPYDQSGHRPLADEDLLVVVPRRRFVLVGEFVAVVGQAQFPTDEVGDLQEVVEDRPGSVLGPCKFLLGPAESELLQEHRTQRRLAFAGADVDGLDLVADGRTEERQLVAQAGIQPGPEQ